MLDTVAAPILVVDDNEAERYYVARVLARAGFDVQEVGTGLDALHLAESGQPAHVTPLTYVAKAPGEGVTVTRWFRHE